MVLSTTESLVLSALKELDSQSFAVTEVALRMFYLLGEVIVDKVGGEGGRGIEGQVMVENEKSSCWLLYIYITCILYRAAILVDLKEASRHGTE